MLGWTIKHGHGISVHSASAYAGLGMIKMKLGNYGEASRYAHLGFKILDYLALNVQ